VPQPAETKPANATDDFVGFVRYNGKLVEGGILDARSAARALHGFDQALRYFVIQERPDLAGIEFPVPVRVDRGSWMAIIPPGVEHWIYAALGVVGTAYVTKAVTKMAERDFENIGFKDLFKKALVAIQWMIRIGKHIGTLAHKKISGIRWRNNNKEVGIPNEKGELLYVPADVLELYMQCPSGILSEVASVVEVERHLTIGVNQDGRVEEVTITITERAIFHAEDEADDALFPELTHGQHVKLEGIVTRGNERANSIGFLYKEHVITCYPRRGNIVRFKPHLFLRCRIIGEVSRDNEETRKLDDPRPKIIFDELILLEDEDQPQLL